MSNLYIGCDHGGYGIKQKIMAKLREMGISYTDVGCDSEEIVRYPNYASMVASAVSRGICQRGILICSTGIGMSIAANKFPNIRASLCSTTYDAKLTRQHNNSNILCLGGKTLGEYAVMDIVETWLTTDYIGGRHDISLGLIKDIEKVNFSGNLWEHFSSES